MTRYGDAAELEQALSSLDDLSFGDLKQFYRKHHKQLPPKRMGRTLLILAIAYEMQRKFHRVRVDRLHKRVRAQSSGSKARQGASQKKTAPRPSLRPGGRLVREWRGKQYEVYVADDGCYLDGKRFRSLSAAAEAITGVKRNGPAFFGLRSTRVRAQ
ncbi:DUF2924 domain-containing protein [Hyphococcus sp. DH-69]|uniref:DUF2924 domain-containing protein n=1 Tax=Hyphococcus formosus TaxID=3143534 RepID=UPI00398B0EBD